MLTNTEITAICETHDLDFNVVRAIEAAVLAKQDQEWNRFHHVMQKHGLHPGRTDDDLIDILDKALSPRTAAQTAEKKSLFIDMIAEHPGLAEEMAAMDAQPVEPVAWVNKHENDSILTTRQKETNEFQFSDEFLAEHTVPLYATPHATAEAIAEVLNAVIGILKGIDSCESSNDDGWWETSYGAAFGKQKLDAIAALRKLGGV